MNYIQRAQVAQRILTAAGNPLTVAVTLRGYDDTVEIQTHGPIPEFEYKPETETSHPTCNLERDGVPVRLVYVVSKEETP